MIDPVVFRASQLAYGDALHHRWPWRAHRWAQGREQSQSQAQAQAQAQARHKSRT